jgi:hypothetical protein
MRAKKLQFLLRDIFQSSTAARGCGEMQALRK